MEDLRRLCLDRPLELGGRIGMPNLSTATEEEEEDDSVDEWLLLGMEDRLACRLRSPLVRLVTKFSCGDVL
jgi:hypothetical protein